MPPKSLGELTKRTRADANDDGEDEDFHARGDDIAEDLFGEKRGLVEKAEGNEDEARQRRQLELDQCDEELNGKDEEGNDHDRPGNHEDGDLNEILEEGDIAHQLAGGREDRRAGVEAHLRDAARMQKIRGRQAGAGGLQAKARKTVKDDFGEAC